MMGRYSRQGKFLCEAAAIAALYAVLTVLLMPICFGAGGTFQLRVSEGLTLLPVLTSSAVPGLFIGCLIANLICGAPLPDIIFGSLATLLAAGITRKLRKNIFLSSLSPVVCNTLIVGTMLSVIYTEPVWFSFLTVALGEIAACCLIGIPLCKSLAKTRLFRENQ